MKSILLVLFIAIATVCWSQSSCETALPLVTGESNEVILTGASHTFTYPEDMSSITLLNVNWYYFQACESGEMSFTHDIMIEEEPGLEMGGLLVWVIYGPYSVLDTADYCNMVFDENIFDILGTFSGGSSISVNNPAAPGEFFLLAAGAYEPYQNFLPGGSFQQDSLAVSGGCIDCQPLIPADICVITTSSTNQNKIIFIKQPEDDNVAEYRIYRESFDPENPELIGTAHANDSSYVIDETTSASQQAFSYYVETEDTCGIILQTEHHTTMYLSVNAGINGLNNLTWTSYQFSDPNVFDRFYLWRGDDPLNLTLFDSVPILQSDQLPFFYTDGTAPPGTAYYQVAFVLEDDCEVTRDYNPQMIYSNIAGAWILDSQEEIAWRDKVNLFPNPSQGDVQLDIDMMNLGQVSASIFDPVGREVRSWTITSSGRHQVMCDGMADGIYLVRLDFGGSLVSIPLVLN